jgi:hypothetical protein
MSIRAFEDRDFRLRKGGATSPLSRHMLFFWMDRTPNSLNAGTIQSGPSTRVKFVQSRWCGLLCYVNGSMSVAKVWAGGFSGSLCRSSLCCCVTCASCHDK